MAASALPPMRPCRRGHLATRPRRVSPGRIRLVCAECELDYAKWRGARRSAWGPWAFPLVDDRRARAWAAAQERMARAIYEARLADGFDGRVEQRPIFGAHNFEAAV